MKSKAILLLALSLLLGSTLFAQQMVRVKTLPEFFENIRSGKKLILDLKDYKLENFIKTIEYDPETKGPKEMKGRRYEVIFTGFTLADSAGTKIIKDAEFYIEITWIEDFQIVGRKTDDGITKLTSSSLHNTIFVFKKSKNVVLRNLRIGHHPEPGYCDGDVIAFEACENIEIDNCELFGSGVRGFVADNVKNLTFSETLIEDCSEAVMDLNNAVDVKINNCIFQNTKGSIEIFNSDDFKNIDPIEFNDCSFSNLGKNVFVLDITKYETIKVNDCIFYGYEEETLAEDPSFIQLGKNKFKKAKKNSFSIF